MEPRVESIVLTLRVPSIEKTVAWYEIVLGWSGHYDTWNEKGECLFGSVAGNHEPFVGFNLSRAAKDAGQPDQNCAHIQVWIYVKDVNEVFDRAVAQGCEILQPPKDEFWGERIFRMLDVNGFELVFSQTVEHLDIDEIRERHLAQPGGQH